MTSCPCRNRRLQIVVLLLLVLAFLGTAAHAFVRPSPLSPPPLPVPSLAPRRGASTMAATPPPSGVQSLLSFMHEERQAQPALVDEDLHLVMAAISSAVKRISIAVRRAGIVDLTGLYIEEGTGAAGVNQGGENQKKLDVVANDILKHALLDCGVVAALASEEEDGVVPLRQGAKFLVVLDPLDGSSNVDASIPTGTIFGVYKSLGDTEAALEAGSLQAGKHQVAAGYCLYAAATLLVFTLGRGTGTHVFTLDPNVGDFVLTTRRLQMPTRGGSYSLNEARYEDWPPGLQRYITDMKLGKGQTGQPYALVYVCSLVADVHWVLVRGGMASNPRSHLRLIYEGNPMGLVTEEAGGLASTGDGPRILDVLPSAVHQRTPVFVGSRDDILELESYGDVAQKHNPGYQAI